MIPGQRWGPGVELEHRNMILILARLRTKNRNLKATETVASCHPFPPRVDKVVVFCKKNPQLSLCSTFTSLTRSFLQDSFTTAGSLKEQGMARQGITYFTKIKAWHGKAYFTKSKVSAERNREYAIVSRMYNDCSFPEYVAQIVL